MRDAARPDPGAPRPLVGELARIRIRAVTHLADVPAEVAREVERELMRRFTEEEAPEVQERILQAAREELGTAPGIQVEPLVVRHGHGIEFLVVLTALGSFLGTYADLVERTTRAVEHTRRIIAATMAHLTTARPFPTPATPEVTATLTLGPAADHLTTPPPPPPRPRHPDLERLALTYALVVGTLLLVAVGFLLGRL
ncbi:hypothetical protein ACWEQL_13910 [Kitasatospora sp. NPDC004240]